MIFLVFRVYNKGQDMDCERFESLWGIFKCISRGFTAGADYAGAVNILRRFLSTMIPEKPAVSACER
jgi:transposase